MKVARASGEFRPDDGAAWTQRIAALAAYFRQLARDDYYWRSAAARLEDADVLDRLLGSATPTNAVDPTAQPRER